MDNLAVSPLVEDGEYQDFQSRLLADYARKFDSWLSRARPTESANRRYTFRNTFKDFLSADQIGESARVKVELVYDLARICRDVVWGEVWAFAFLMQRRGTSVDEILRQLPERVNLIESRVRVRKWQVGLKSVEEFSFYSLVPNEWHLEAWRVVVTDAVPSFLDDCLSPALERHANAIHAEVVRLNEQLVLLGEKICQIERRASTLAKEAVSIFMATILDATGHKITKRDIALVAGYGDTTELKRFQRSDKKLTRTGNANFERTLKMAPHDFVVALQKRRKAANP
jgi:hypothetical protein